MLYDRGLNFNALATGQSWPLPFDHDMDGSELCFLVNGGNTLLVALPEIGWRDLWTLQQDAIHISIYEEQCAALLLFQFGDSEERGKLNKTFQFNAVTIPDGLFKEREPEVAGLYHREVDMIVVDTHDGLIKALRSFTLPPVLHRGLVDLAWRQRFEQRDRQRVATQMEFMESRLYYKRLIVLSPIYRCAV